MAGAWMAISQLEITMDLIRSMHPLARAWLLDGPLSSYIEAFQALLERGRYAEGSSAAALRAWSHFAHWMTKCHSLRQAMTRSNVPQRLALAVKAAALTTPSLAGRTISPHCLRHSTAMHLLQSGVDISVIALWLGHESPTTTHQYVEADLAMKEKALARLQDPNVAPRRFRADDDLLKFLKTL